MILKEVPVGEAPEMMQRAVKLLNECLRLDPEAVSKVFCHEVPINDALSSTPLDITCSCYSTDIVDGGPRKERCTMGPLGFIAGMVNTEKYRIFRSMPDSSPDTIIAFGVYRVEES